MTLAFLLEERSAREMLLGLLPRLFPVGVEFKYVVFVPDDIGAPARELAAITRNNHRKLSGSRAIGAELSLSGNASRSFQVFLTALRRLADSAGVPHVRTGHPTPGELALR